MSEQGVSLTVQVEDTVSPALAELVRQLGELDQTLEEIGASQVTEVQHRFEAMEGPDGGKWASLSEVTLDARKKSGRSGKAQILRLTGDLYDSITYQVLSGQAVQIGTNKVYARIHQLGGQAGRGHKTTIPARPYLGLSEAGKREIEQIFRDHIAGRA